MATKKKVAKPTPLTKEERKVLSRILAKARAFKAFKAANESDE